VLHACTTVHCPLTEFHNCFFRPGIAAKKEMSTAEEELHGVLIVGGGICGLATALALHMYE
jgi:heterodisulfide reductase subunit A-like polyferredoxin